MLFKFFTVYLSLIIVKIIIAEEILNIKCSLKSGIIVDISNSDSKSLDYNTNNRKINNRFTGNNYIPLSDEKVEDILEALINIPNDTKCTIHVCRNCYRRDDDGRELTFQL